MIGPHSGAVTQFCRTGMLRAMGAAIDLVSLFDAMVEIVFDTAVAAQLNPGQPVDVYLSP